MGKGKDEVSLIHMSERLSVLRSTLAGRAFCLGATHECAHVCISSGIVRTKLDEPTDLR